MTHSRLLQASHTHNLRPATGEGFGGEEAALYVRLSLCLFPRYRRVLCQLNKASSPFLDRALPIIRKLILTQISPNTDIKVIEAFESALALLP